MSTRIAFLLLIFSIAACSDEDPAAPCLAGARVCISGAVHVCDPALQRFVLEYTCPEKACLRGACAETAFRAGTDVADSSDISDVVQKDRTDVKQPRDLTEPDLGSELPGPREDIVLADVPEPEPDLPVADVASELPPDAQSSPDVLVEDEVAQDLGSVSDQGVAADDAIDATDGASEDTDIVGDDADSVLTELEPPSDEGSVDSGPAPFDPGWFVYERLSTPGFTCDEEFHRVAYEADGEVALMLGHQGRVVTYTVATETLADDLTLGDSVADLAMSDDGTVTAVLGMADDSPALWRREAGQYTMVATPGLGQAVAIAAEPGARRFAIATRTQNAGAYINYLYLWHPDTGLSAPQGYAAGSGVMDITWGAATLFGSPFVLTSDGLNGADSHTWLPGGQVEGNGWPNSFGNCGGAAWRPGGSYGLLTGWSSNKLYVFDGAWELSALPGVGTAGSPNAVAWHPSGRRAIVVGRVVGGSGVVVDYRPGDALDYDGGFLMNQSIPNFEEAPWFGHGNVHLRAAAWRPASSCDEGIIVGSDLANCTLAAGYVIRFYDVNDPDCVP